MAIASAVSGGTATAEFAWIDAAGFVGAAIGTFAAVTAIATTPASPGLLPGRVSSARAVAIAACAPWIAATFGELHGGAARDLTARLAAPLAIGVVLGHTLVARAARELELDPVWITSSDPGAVHAAFLAWADGRLNRRGHR